MSPLPRLKACALRSLRRVSTVSVPECFHIHIRLDGFRRFDDDVFHKASVKVSKPRMKLELKSALSPRHLTFSGMTTGHRHGASTDSRVPVIEFLFSRDGEAKNSAVRLSKKDSGVR